MNVYESSERNCRLILFYNSTELVKRKGGAQSIPFGSSGPQAVSQTLENLALQGLGNAQLKEALKGVGLPCGVCGAAKSDVTLQPCQHKCVCSSCSVKVTVCPLCDEEVKDKLVTGAGEQAEDNYKNLVSPVRAICLYIVLRILFLLYVSAHI